MLLTYTLTITLHMQNATVPSFAQWCSLQDDFGRFWSTLLNVLVFLLLTSLSEIIMIIISAIHCKEWDNTQDMARTQSSHTPTYLTNECFLTESTTCSMWQGKALVRGTKERCWWPKRGRLCAPKTGRLWPHTPHWSLLQSSRRWTGKSSVK